MHELCLLHPMIQSTLKLYTLRNIDSLRQFQQLDPEAKEALRVVAHILPFRVNNYVVENLIDWNNIPNDPIYQLTFMQKGMLDDSHYDQMKRFLSDPSVSKGDLAAIIYKIRKELNPHPAGQLSSNVPTFEDRPVPGVQHKYKQTALVFPSAGQQCHSYCTFCFRWPQFIGESDLKFATDSQMTYLKYLREHEELTDVLFTGGDPMVMNAKLLEKHLAPLLTPDYNHIQNIRIGSKSLSYWPQRFVSDKDSNEVLDLFKRINDSGKQLAFMAHINHINELQTDIVQEAIYKIRQTGTQIRTQAPLLRHINDDSAMWANMWKLQVRLGMVPYYFFIERDTGPKNYFSLPLAKTWEIYKNALQEVSGLARTVRGPSMSASPGKVAIEGMNVINGEKVFVLTLLQARNPNHIKKPFLAKFDENAIWFDQLVPAFGESKFFFEK